jgi:hypothetical protein
MGARMTRKPRTRGNTSRDGKGYERLRDLSEIKHEKILDDKGQETSGSVTNQHGGGTNKNPLADPNRKRQGGRKKEKATCYNTDEVVREYEDPKKKLKKQKELFKAFLNRNDKDRKYSFDEVQAILNDLTKDDKVKKLKYPGLTPKQRKLQLEIDSEQREDPYDPDPPICKTNTDARTYTEPGRGGFAGREPGETCDYNESTSIHDVNQPKHVNRPTNADGAEGVKKESGNVYSGKPEGVKFDPKNPTHLKELGERWNDPQQGKLNEPRITARSGYCSQINVDRESHKNAGDPQLAANNAEDGIKDKFRLDNDPPAESFENKSEPSPEDNKINPAGWCPGESIQKPGTFASTDEHHAMVLGDVPPSNVVGSQTHNNSEDGPHESEMNDKKYNHGLNQFQGEAQSHKSTNINDQGHGSGGVRAGASYDNSQQDTGAKDNPRVVIEEDYAGGEDTGNNSRNREDEDKEAAKEQETPKGLSKATIILDTLNLKLKL